MALDQAPWRPGGADFTYEGGEGLAVEPGRRSLHAVEWSSLASMVLEAQQRPRASNWSPDDWLVAVASSPIKTPVKETLNAMLASTGDRQFTDVDRQSICNVVGVKRTATITEHWKIARDYGLMVSRRRHNASAKHKLTIPGVDSSGIDDIDMTISTNTHVHVWTAAELLWWRQVDDRPELRPPWGDGPAPF